MASNGKDGGASHVDKTELPHRDGHHEEENPVEDFCKIDFEIAGDLNWSLLRTLLYLGPLP